MPNTTGEKRVSQWTLESLHEHFRVVLDERAKLNAQRFQAAETATKIAMEAAEKLRAQADRDIEKWREASNEWRKAMNDRESQFVRKEENNACVQGLEKAIDALKERMDRNEGRASGQHSMWLYLGGFIALIGSGLGILVVVMNFLTASPK